MEASILNSTKKVLGLAPDYDAFDEDILMHINAAFSIIAQLGIGPLEGFSIEDDQAKWIDIGLPAIQLNLVRSLVFLRVRKLFDPPGTSYLIESMDRQIAEFEWRLNVMREELIPIPVLEEEVP